MICLLCYRFSAFPVLPTYVATKAGGLANIFIHEHTASCLSGTICNEIFKLIYIKRDIGSVSREVIVNADYS
jgi:hypothetical protein